MIGNRFFWRVYALASVCSGVISVYLFHLAVEGFHRPYEEAAIVAGLLAMPVNWLVGEQLTWGSFRSGRSLRAARYFTVYGIGLLIDTLLVHLVGHVWFVAMRFVDVAGVLGSMLWTAPMNRYWTWKEERNTWPSEIREP